MINHNNDLTTQLLNHLTMSAVTKCPKEFHQPFIFFGDWDKEVYVFGRVFYVGLSESRPATANQIHLEIYQTFPIVNRLYQQLPEILHLLAFTISTPFNEQHNDFQRNSQD